MCVTQPYKKVTLELTKGEHLQVLAALYERERELTVLLNHDQGIAPYWTRKLVEIQAVIEKVAA